MAQILKTDNEEYLLNESGNKLIVDAPPPPGYLSIKDQLVAILNTLVPDSLAVVYGKEEKILKQYPAACISAKENSNEYQSVGLHGKNKHVYQHYIRIYFKTDENNDTDYEDVLEGIADDVISVLEQNITLNGVCDYSIPISGMWHYGTKESPERVLEIVEVSTILVSR